MKLYAIPFACSFAAHLAMRVWNLDHVLIWVDRATHRGADGVLLSDLNPKDRVSTLVIGDRVITENAAVLLHLAGQGGRVASINAAVRHTEWLSFVATELHKQVMAQVYTERTPVAERERLIDTVLPWGLGIADARLEGRDWLVGDAVGPADLYLFWVLVLARNLGIDLDRWPNVRGLMRRIGATSWAQAAIEIEQAEYAKSPRVIARAAG